MSRINDLLGSDFALSLEFDSRYGIGEGPEVWSANLVTVGYEDESDEPQREIVASAQLARVHFEEDWGDQLDAASGDLESVVATFKDPDGMVSDDPLEFGYTDNLVIIDFISVPKNYRGSKYSHLLVKAIALVFADSAIALVPAQLSSDGGGEIFEDPVKHKALVRHWAALGLIATGGNVMVLPIGARDLWLRR